MIVEPPSPTSPGGTKDSLQHSSVTSSVNSLGQQSQQESDKVQFSTANYILSTPLDTLNKKTVDLSKLLPVPVNQQPHGSKVHPAVRKGHSAMQITRPSEDMNGSRLRVDCPAPSPVGVTNSNTIQHARSKDVKLAALLPEPVMVVPLSNHKQDSYANVFVPSSSSVKTAKMAGSFTNLLPVPVVYPPPDDFYQYQQRQYHPHVQQQHQIHLSGQPHGCSYTYSHIYPEHLKQRTNEHDCDIPQSQSVSQHRQSGYSVTNLEAGGSYGGGGGADTAMEIKLEKDRLQDTFGEMVADSPGGRAVPLVVLDCANIGWTYGQNECFDATGVYVAMQYFAQQLQLDVQGFLPASYLRARPRGTDPDRSSALMQTDDVALLTQLMGSGLLTIVPTGDSDDAYILNYARENNGFVVSNDLFHDHMRALAAVESVRSSLQCWLQEHRCGYAFSAKGEFLVNPASALSRVVQQYVQYRYRSS
jgi:hypothetical protein